MANVPEKAIIPQSASIEDAFHFLNENQLGIVFAVDGNDRVVGCITDGDIRRQLLVRSDLSIAISTFMNRDFVWVQPYEQREKILKLLDHGIHVIPVLDEVRQLIGLCTRSDFRLQDEGEVFARARAPARISFGGGGSDLTHYFLNNGGMVINATIAKYAHATLRRRRDTTIRIYSYDLDLTVEAESLSDLKLDSRLDLIKSVVRLISPAGGFDLEVATDFPMGSGLGGSASLAAAIIGCFNEFRADTWSRHQIAEMAFQSERLYLNIAGGWQDQYAAVFGGFNYMEFTAQENLIVPLRLEGRIKREIEASTILCYTGKNHDSSLIHKDQKQQFRMSELARAATQRQKEMTLEMKRLLLRGDVYGYGSLLHDAWQAKRAMGTLISDAEIDRVYDHARQNGALGGKVLGAGGGGYFMFFVSPFDRYRLSRALETLGYKCERLILDEDGLVSWKMRLPNTGGQEPANILKV